MATSLDLSRTYTSYSGVDIKVIINGKPAGSMQALSYAIQREKAPIYVMGSVDPVSYSRGKRGIAGTMISLMMDHHFLMSPSFQGETYLADKDEIFASQNSQVPNATLNNAQGDGSDNPGINLKTAQSDSITPTKARLPGGLGYRLDTSRTDYDVASLGTNYEIAPVYYVDQILPFDIAIMAANEYGQSAQMRLYGCEILNEGSGFSIDDIVIENQMTYVCRTILPWRSFDLQGHGQSNRLDGDMNGSASTRDALYNTAKDRRAANQR
jgi:hypothetical protein